MHRVLLQFTCNPKFIFIKVIVSWTADLVYGARYTFIFHSAIHSRPLPSLKLLYTFQLILRVFVNSVYGELVCLYQACKHASSEFASTYPYPACINVFFLIHGLMQKPAPLSCPRYMSRYMYLWKCHSRLRVFNFSKAFCRNSVTRHVAPWKTKL